jgi:hypothetical protein
MHEEILVYLRKNGPMPSLVLAREFLKFKNPGENLAHVAVTGILSRDARFVLGADNLWRASAAAPAAAASRPLSEILWAAVYFLALPQNPSAAVHASAWTVGDAPEMLCERWLVDPASLPYEEQELLTSVGDAPFAGETVGEKVSALVSACEGKTPLFLSSRQQSLFARLGADAGRFPPDNAVLVGTLFSCCGQPAPRPLTLEQCETALFGAPSTAGYAYRRGERLASCCARLLDEMREKGIAGFAGIEEAEQKELSSFDFSGKTFSRDDVAAAPAAPGVYGFKARDGSYLYIGKAKNLRRRLASYFRPSDESPDKLDRIRAEAHGLVTYRCGSELESLVYEYRLIRKHSPALNNQVDIVERKGDFIPIDDCVVLLPHAEKEKGMSVWFRRNQKINLRPFFSDFRDGRALETELESFFFGGALPPNPTDFPEQEIATRWVKRRRDELCVVQVNRASSGREVCGMMKSYWKDCDSRSKARNNDSGSIGLD